MAYPSSSTYPASNLYPANDYAATVLADSPRGYWRLGTAFVVPSAATASSTFSFSSPANAIDGDGTNVWVTAAGAVAAWLRLQYPSAVTLTKYVIRGENDPTYGTRSPKAWTFEGSNDGTTWTVLDTRSNITWTAAVSQAFTFTNATAYTYYRLNITANNGDPSYTQVNELITYPSPDASGNGRDLVPVNTVASGASGLVSGDTDTAVSFTGAGFLRVPDYGSWLSPTAMTIEAIIKTSSTALMSIVDRDDTHGRAWQFRVNAGKLEFITINGGAGTVGAAGTTSNLADGNPHHVAASYDASNIRLYVDGVLQTTQPAVGALSTATANLAIGANFSGVASGAALYTGTIDEVAFYGTALSGTRIAAHAAARSSSSSSPQGVAALTASSSLTATATVVPGPKATLTASSSLTAAATVVPGTTATLTASSTLTATATVVPPSKATMTASSVLTADGHILATYQGAVNLQASSSLTADGQAYWEPFGLTGKQLWLRAKDLPVGAATAWPDKSGTNVTITGTGGAGQDGATPSGGRALVPSGGAFPSYAAPSWGMPAASSGEFWIVLESYQDPNGAWGLGTSGSASKFTAGRTYNVLDDTGSSTQKVFDLNFTVTLNTWRVYRVVINGGTWTAYIDNAQVYRATGSSRAWASAPKALASFNGAVAEILVVSRTLTTSEATTVYRYLNAQHGLTIPAAITITATAPMASSSALTADAYVGRPEVSAEAALAASSSLTGTVAPVRLAEAVLTASSLLKASAQATLWQAIAELTSTSTLEATPVPPAQWDATATLYAAAALFVDADNAVSAQAALVASSVLTATGKVRTPWVEPNDPRTGRPQYRLIVAHRDGERLAELTDANVSAIEAGVGTGSSFNFEVATADPKWVAYGTAAGRQAQVWRGTELVFRGPIVTIDDDQDNGSTTVKCRDPFWYLESGRRVIGRIPKRQLLINGSFETGEEPPWQGAFAPDSIPAAQPVRDVIDVDFFGTQMKALQISGVDKVVTVTKELKTAAVFVPNSAEYLPGGESTVKAVAALMPKTGSLSVDVKGYTADNRINGDYGDGMALSLARAKAAAATIKSVRPNASTTTEGYGYYFQIPGGLDANRRVVISWSGVQEASGHRQYEVQKVPILQPVDNKSPLPLTFVGWTKITKWLGPSKDGWGVYIQVANPAKPKDKPIDSAYASIDEKTPRNRWLRMEATVEVPADGIPYEVEVRFYPPAGTALWTLGGLYPGDQLGFFDVDQALIIEGLVQHAQNERMGKGDLGIDTRCQPTGIVRTREYPFDERMPIDQAINEIASLYKGPEVVMEVTDSSQTVVTYHPRQGRATGEVLIQGGNVVAFNAPTDNREAASSIIMQSDGSGADREEGYAHSSRALDGLMLERVISTEGETPVTELEEAATNALTRLWHPRPAVWVTIDPDRTGQVRDALGQGDTLRAIIPDAGIDGTYRYVKSRLHPGADVLELMLSPDQEE